jgi:hypothetical protein
MVLVLAFIAIFTSYAAPGPYAGPSPHICTPSVAGMQAICRETATG